MKNQSISFYLEDLWRQKYFIKERTFEEISNELGKNEINPNSNALTKALTRSKILTRRGRLGKYKYIQKHPSIGNTSNKDILPSELLILLKKDFSNEIADLRHNFGKSGTCTAFLLRKILEKLIFLVFTKNGDGEKLYDSNKQILGLNTLLSLAISCKVHGKPYLLNKTKDSIQGLKFLGDAAAHNPLINVSMDTIYPVMPFIITAYSELASKL